MPHITALISVLSLMQISFSFKYPHIFSNMVAFCGLSFFLAIIIPSDSVGLSYIRLEVYINFGIVFYSARLHWYDFLFPHSVTAAHNAFHIQKKFLANKGAQPTESSFQIYLRKVKFIIFFKKVKNKIEE